MCIHACMLGGEEVWGGGVGGLDMRALPLSWKDLAKITAHTHTNTPPLRTHTLHPYLRPLLHLHRRQTPPGCGRAVTGSGDCAGCGVLTGASSAQSGRTLLGP